MDVASTGLAARRCSESFIRRTCGGRFAACADVYTAVHILNNSGALYFKIFKPFSFHIFWRGWKNNRFHVNVSCSFELACDKEPVTITPKGDHVVGRRRHRDSLHLRFRGYYQQKNITRNLSQRVGWALCKIINKTIIIIIVHIIIIQSSSFQLMLA